MTWNLFCFSKKIGKPATRALQNSGTETLEQLAEYRENDIMDIHGIGIKAVGIIKQALAENGLAFKK
jgi:DNA-directed RNA polymerase alpha subunit